MWAKRGKDLIAVWLIGDGVLTVIAPRQRALLWRLGPKRLRKSILWQANYPSYMRLEGITSIGLWMALRQYRETPRPWYRR